MNPEVGDLEGHVVSYGGKENGRNLTTTGKKVIESGV
jgi:hypothetical protein